MHKKNRVNSLYFMANIVCRNVGGVINMCIQNQTNYYIYHLQGFLCVLLQTINGIKTMWY